MRRKWTCCIVLMVVVLWSVPGFCWRTELQVAGQDLGVVRFQDVEIGVEVKASQQTAPPTPVEYTATLELVDPDWNRLAQDIQKTGKVSYEWIVAVNPHGNVMPPAPRSAILTWFPFQLGPGRFELREGADGFGETVVPDMKAVDHVEIVGGNETKYFTIYYAPEIDAP